MENLNEGGTSMRSNSMEIPIVERSSAGVCVIDSGMRFLEAVKYSAPPLRRVAMGPLKSAVRHRRAVRAKG